LVENKKTAKKVVKKTAKKVVKKTAKKVVKKTAKKGSKKKINSEPLDSGIVIVDDDLSVDKESELEERRAYLEEARSQEASSD
jgi:hypothetical protein